MATDTELIFEIGKNAQAIMRSLQDKKLTFAQALDILSMALILSAFNAEIDKQDFLNNTSDMWDMLKEEVKDKQQSGKYEH
jgi:hypothetical protein